MTPARHFLNLDELDGETLRSILTLAAALKKGTLKLGPHPLANRILAMIFEKPSTRTRTSFEVGMRQLGGGVISLSHSDTQLGRGETIADTARTLSRYVDAIMIRTDLAQKLIELATHSSIPVINGLTDDTHPCQIMADVMTYEEHRGPIEGKAVAWIGDGNNVATSWIQAAAHFNFEMRLACPPSLAPPIQVIEWARSRGARIVLTADPSDAARQADCVVTDTWVSMGVTDHSRTSLLAPYQINESLMAIANTDAVFMHCLPAHRGEEVTAGVIDGPQSLVWDEAENRLHAQKAILIWCLLPPEAYAPLL